MPGEHIHMNLIKMATNKKEYTLVLTLVDKFSGFVWLWPILWKTKSIVAEEVLKIFLEYGFPKTIKTDNGTEFINGLVDEVCELAKVKHNLIIADHHIGQGLVERQNRTVRDTLAKLLKESEKQYPNDWEQLIPAVMFAMNARIHKTSVATPFALMFGRGPFNLAVSTKDIDLRKDQQVMIHFWETFKQEVPQQLHELKLKKAQKTRYCHHKSQY